MSQPNHQLARRLGSDLVSFGTNGESFEKLLENARCVSSPQFITLMKGFPFNSFNSSYGLLTVCGEMKMIEIIIRSRIDYAVTRELVNFTSLFPDFVRQFDRVPAFGRDICSSVDGNIPTIRKLGDGFELYAEHISTIWTNRDAPLKREPLVA